MADRTKMTEKEWVDATVNEICSGTEGPIEELLESDPLRARIMAKVIHLLSLHLDNCLAAQAYRAGKE